MTPLRYLYNAAVVLDMAANTILFAGSPAETISSRTYIAARKGKAWALWLEPKINVLMRDDRHCENAWKSAQAYAESVLARGIKPLE